MTDLTSKTTTALKRQPTINNHRTNQPFKMMDSTCKSFMGRNLHNNPKSTKLLWFKMMGFRWTSFMAKLQSHINHLNQSLKTMDLLIKTISKAILNHSSSNSSSMIKNIIKGMITANRIINMTITKIRLNKTTITIKDMIKATTTRATATTMTINSKPINQSTVSKPTPKNKKTKIGTTQQVVLLRKRHPQPNSSRHSMQTCRLRIVHTKIICSRCANANNRQQLLSLCLTHTPPKINLSHLLLLINSHTNCHSKHTNSRRSNLRHTNSRNSSLRQTTSWQK